VKFSLLFVFRNYFCLNYSQYDTFKQNKESDMLYFIKKNKKNERYCIIYINIYINQEGIKLFQLQQKKKYKSI